MRVLLSLWECFPRWDHKWQPCTLLLSWGEGLAMFLSCGHTVEHVALRLYWGRVPTRNERSATNNTNIYQPFQVLLTYHFSFSILGKLHIFYSFLGTLTKQETGNCGNCFKTGGDRKKAVIFLTTPLSSVSKVKIHVHPCIISHCCCLLEWILKRNNSDFHSYSSKQAICMISLTFQQGLGNLQE